MVEAAKTVLIFLIVFLVTYFMDYVIYYRKIKKNKVSREKMPTNVKYLVYKYNIDVVRLGLKEVYKHLMLCDSFIMAVLFMSTAFIKNIYLRLFVAFLLVFPLFAGVYHLVAMYYKKESER